MDINLILPFMVIFPMISAVIGYIIGRKNKKARDVMMNAPSIVTDKQLEDVHIRVTEQEEENK